MQQLRNDSEPYDSQPQPASPEELGELPLAPAEPVVLDRSPGILPVLARALWRAAGRPQGVLPAGASFPALVTRLPGVRVAAAQVASYRKVCHLAGDKHILPLPMPEILFFGLLGNLATDARLPISPFGLIHVRQTMTGEEPIEVDRQYDLEARLAVARRTDKGCELDIRLLLADQDQILWQAVTTLLSRAPSARTGARRGTPRLPAEQDGLEIRVPGDTGRAYAGVSGDWNPHHLWPVTARPLGYRRPIAHGMWTLARLIGLLPAEVDTTTGRVEASFRRPVLMPGVITVRVAPEDDRWQLDAWSPERGTPHLRSTYTSARQR